MMASVSKVWVVPSLVIACQEVGVAEASVPMQDLACEESIQVWTHTPLFCVKCGQQGDTSQKLNAPRLGRFSK
jgi:hypothetical protein